MVGKEEETVKKIIKNQIVKTSIELEEYIPLPAACRPFVGADGRGSLFPSAAGTVSGLWHVDGVCAGVVAGVPADIVRRLLLLLGGDAFAGKALPAQIKRIKKKRMRLVPITGAAHPLVRCVPLLF